MNGSEPPTLSPRTNQEWTRVHNYEAGTCISSCKSIS
jgi:hypothetical protein